jgi:hypothetical protein
MIFSGMDSRKWAEIMAGDWIKVEKATARKFEVLRIAEHLAVHPDHAFGLCVRFWFWCDDNMTDGHAPSVTNVTLDSVIGHAGFTDALIKVDWLRVRHGSLEVPNFDRHLSESAKNRSLSAERKRKQRHATVTVSAGQKRDQRREEKSTNKETKAKKIPFVPPSLEQVEAYCRERGNAIDPVAFLAHYNANGWVQGKGKPVVDWKACVVTWERNARAREPKATSRIATPEDGARWNPTDAGLGGFDG